MHTCKDSKLVRNPYVAGLVNLEAILELNGANFPFSVVFLRCAEKLLFPQLPQPDGT